MTIEKDPLVKAEPKKFALPSGRTALVIIDMQRDFVQEGGYGFYQCPSRQTFDEVSQIIPNIQNVLNAARSVGLEVIHTREGHVSDLSDCHATKLYRQAESNPQRHTLKIGDKGALGRLLVRGEYGHDIIDSLKPLKSEYVLDKPAKGSFCNTNFYQVLTARGITHLLLAGVTTECCVATTFREANDRGFECCVLSDCTGGFDAGIYEWTLKGFSAYDGLFGYVSSSQDVLDAIKGYQPEPAQLVVDSNPLSIKSLQKMYSGNPSLIGDVLKSLAVFPNFVDPQNSQKWQTFLDSNDSSDLPPLYGVPFLATEEIPVNSMVIQMLESKGAVYMGSVRTQKAPTAGPREVSSLVTSNCCSFVLAIDYQSDIHYAPTKDSEQEPDSPDSPSTIDSTAVASINGSVCAFSPTFGTISSEGCSSKCPSYGRISILSMTMSDCRKVWQEVVSYNPQDVYSLPYNTIPTPGIDYRGLAAGGFKFGALSEEALRNSGMCEDTCGTYKLFLERLSSKLSSSIVDIDPSMWSEAASKSKILYSQELLAYSYSGNIHPGMQNIIALREFELPGWKVATVNQEYKKLSHQISQAFKGSEGLYCLIVPSAFSYFSTGFESCYCTYKQPFGISDLSITCISPSGFDWKLADLAEIF